ncbi:MAG: LemA family protein, partial [Oscillospiraceae bacterium]|nr:LemA family protein [Oscillospiraceae bacterium]
GTLEQVVALRNQAAAASTDQEKIQLNNQLSGALSRLLVTVEAYPELKANANFLDLQNQLKDTEQKIAISRQIYNDSVTKYNRALQMFPGNIVASMFHYERKEYLEAADTERQNVKVEF